MLAQTCSRNCSCRALFGNPQGKQRSRQHRPVCRSPQSSQLFSSERDDSDREKKRPLVRVPEQRQPAAAPAPVAVQHSSSFLIHKQRPPTEEEARRQDPEAEEPFAGNAIEWTLRKWDKSLSKQESNPSQATRAAWQVGSSPVGSAAGKGVSGAAKASLAIGQEAVKAAVPAGKWAVGQGLGLAWKLATKKRSKPPPTER
ncbi:hypothetical protein WJX73_006066 [Symbiochloris irregularis]|uniref:Uncharacterized protein n=1 Tax=Symbiochloris irregularis TaxID=706552 RepID=A0AAW1P9G6_9CHLO